MEEYTLQFKDDNDRIITILMIILSIFAGFVPSILVVLLCPNMLSENSLKFAKALFNFEVTLLIIAIVIGLVSLGFLSTLIVLINIILMLINVVAISQNTPVKLIKSIKLL